MYLPSRFSTGRLWAPLIALLLLTPGRPLMAQKTKKDKTPIAVSTQKEVTPSGPSIDETSLVMLVRTLNDDIVGTSSETTLRKLNSFRDSTYNREIVVNSAVVVGFQHPEAQNLYNWNGYYWVKKLQPYGSFSTDSYNYLKNPPQQVLCADKSYQDHTVRYIIAGPQSVLDNARVGQKVSFKMRLRGCHTQPNGGTTSFEGIYTIISFGIIESFSAETKSFKCENGHEYPASSGSKFCPIDGKPLK